ncbi:MAG: hypothetical protein M0Q41_12855 [Bacteroidales bacterium]|jgi:hypothetical protein|nr:hypothetical protein [Bacteroidales bacterium]
MKSNPSQSSTLPGRSKNPRTNQNLSKSLPAPTPGMVVENAAKMKYRIMNDKNGQLVTAPILHAAPRGNQDNKS